MAAIYPVARAVEHAAGLAGVQPLRVFAVLWPLWQVEITARVEDPAEYELLDSFVTRAVGQAGLDTAAAVAGFLGLGERTVRGCVQYLMTVGHLAADGERLELTPRGQRSMHDGRRYESKEVRQQLLFDRYTAGPFPRSHYANAVTVLDRPDPSLDGVRGSRFTALFAGTTFRPEIVDALVRRPDRTGYNVPAEIDRPRVDGLRDAWLPAYLVRTGQGLLAYTAASDGRDAFIEGLCRQAPGVTSALPDTPPEDAERRWKEWLLKEHGGGTLRRQPNGVWRGTLPASAFAAGNRRLASYVVHDELFLQLWCDDRALRRTAMRDRAADRAEPRRRQPRRPRPPPRRPRPPVRGRAVHCGRPAGARHADRPGGPARPPRRPARHVVTRSSPGRTVLIGQPGCGSAASGQAWRAVLTSARDTGRRARSVR